MKVYLDMDGVLVDFMGQIRKYAFLLKCGKVDWNKVIARGPEFWVEMNWLEGAEESFRRLQTLAAEGKIELFILSAINFKEGVEGKKLWLSKNTSIPPKNVFIVGHSSDKARFAAPDAILIDDRSRCTVPFSEAGGKAILFTSWKTSLSQLRKLL